jgi:hypothetical protein
MKIARPDVPFQKSRRTKATDNGTHRATDSSDCIVPPAAIETTSLADVCYDIPAPISFNHYWE